jgi:hypothetical protein
MMLALSGQRHGASSIVGGAYAGIPSTWLEWKTA